MILSGKVSTIKPTYIWNKLTHLRLTNCGLTRLDPSLHFLSALVSLDVSYNEISHIVHLHDCGSLRVFNISHNRISVLSNLIWVIPNIQRLNLSYNQIESLDGLDKLHQLQKLDVSHNRLSDFHEIQSLSRLRFLNNIYLLGNILASKPNYRLHVTSQFLNDCSLEGRELPYIDGKGLSEKESYTLK
jgi:Leucine-rich repeat (LRR) protein